MHLALSVVYTHITWCRSCRLMLLCMEVFFIKQKKNMSANVNFKYQLLILEGLKQFPLYSGNKRTKSSKVIEVKHKAEINTTSLKQASPNNPMWIIFCRYKVYIYSTCVMHILSEIEKNSLNSTYCFWWEKKEVCFCSHCTNGKIKMKRKTQQKLYSLLQLVMTLLSGGVSAA